MGKKNKGKQNQPNNPSKSAVSAPSSSLPQTPLISKRGWKIIGAGIVVLIAGYGVLSLADPMGQNWASHVSPFLIIGGYAIVGIGIISKDPVV